MAKLSNTTREDARRLDEATAALEPIVVNKAAFRGGCDGPTTSMAGIPDEKWNRIFGASRTVGRKGAPRQSSPLAERAGLSFGGHDARSAMDRMTGHLVRHGITNPGDVTADQAQAIARTCAHRKDHQSTGQEYADRAGRHPVKLEND
ncbi:MAG: hypothetical protein ACYTGX_15575 [Planctomycetota bacterium]|jgi:hypothetical protein